MNKDNMLDGMTETISLNKIVEFDGTQVLNMTADVRSEPNSQMNYTVSVLNNVLYTENLEYFRKEIQEFKQVVYERENYLFEFYYPEKEEAVEEETVEEEPTTPDEEDIPEP